VSPDTCRPPRVRSSDAIACGRSRRHDRRGNRDGVSMSDEACRSTATGRARGGRARRRPIRARLLDAPACSRACSACARGRRVRGPLRSPAFRVRRIDGTALIRHTRLSRAIGTAGCGRSRRRHATLCHRDGRSANDQPGAEWRSGAAYDNEVAKAVRSRSALTRRR
jgi:hypothetical protein